LINEMTSQAMETQAYGLHEDNLCGESMNPSVKNNCWKSVVQDK